MWTKSTFVLQDFKKIFSAGGKIGEIWNLKTLYIWTIFYTLHNNENFDVEFCTYVKQQINEVSVEMFHNPGDLLDWTRSDECYHPISECQSCWYG
jgi:hypothetical protein